MSTPVWLDGRLLDEDDARIHVFDHGVTVGDGCFETLRTERGVPFAMRRHLVRLRRSLTGLGLDLAVDDETLRDAMLQVASRIDGPGRVRLTVTGGVGPAGTGRGDAAPTVYVTGGPVPDRPPTAACIVVPWTRNERSPVAGLKTTSYAENVVALAEATRQGAQEAILANTVGRLCEGTGSNVFVVVDGELLTPPLSSGCLAGITRELVLECTGAREADLPIEVLGIADEVFLTSSTRDVQGQHRVGDRSLDAPGPVTRSAMQAFADLVEGNLDP